MTKRSRIVVLCTGNAARSVMGGYMLGYLAETQGLAMELVTAGTHAIEGQPMSMRTKNAIVQFDGLQSLPLGQHRSHQLTDADAEWADLIICMEADHVRYVRRVHPAAASRTATLPHLVANLPSGEAGLRERVLSCALDAHDFEVTAEIDDPAGGDQDVYYSCANQLMEHFELLIERC
jgi:protein-tyrosine phosphatase